MSDNRLGLETGKNMFGKCSRFEMTAADRSGRTILTDVHFTAPYKMMTPFENRDGSIQVMLLSASAGIMAGDEQEFSFCIGRGARVEFVSQSYEKIHKMAEGCAHRQTHIIVCPEGEFYYHPQPTIPFAGSAYHSEMDVHLEDSSAHFVMGEILSCGRYARGERFAYRYYHNRVKIYRGDRLIYLDNSRYEPELWDMEGFGMYESYTHLANLFFTAHGENGSFQEQAADMLAADETIDGGITRLASGDYAVRIFGGNAQILEEKMKAMEKLYQETL